MRDRAFILIFSLFCCLPALTGGCTTTDNWSVWDVHDWDVYEFDKNPGVQDGIWQPPFSKPRYIANPHEWESYDSRGAPGHHHHHDHHDHHDRHDHDRECD